MSQTDCLPELDKLVKLKNPVTVDVVQLQEFVDDVVGEVKILQCRSCVLERNGIRSVRVKLSKEIQNYFAPTKTMSTGGRVATNSVTTMPEFLN